MGIHGYMGTYREIEGLCSIGFRWMFTPLTGIQMGKAMEHDMETRVYTRVRHL